jgi:protein-L-isoaspartate O-methyltransferase
MIEEAKVSKRISGGSGYYYAGNYPQLHQQMRTLERSHPLLERFRRDHETLHFRPHVKHRLGDEWFAIEQDLEFDLKME